MTQSYSFTQESLIKDFMDLPSEVAEAGQAVIEAQYEYDMLNLNIDMAKEKLKSLESALYTEYKNGDRLLSAKCKPTEKAILAAIDIDPEVTKTQDLIQEAKEELILLKKTLAEKELRSNVFAFTKMQAMKQVHTQLLREMISDDITDKLAGLDTHISNLDTEIAQIKEFQTKMNSIKQVRKKSKETQNV